MKKFSVKLISFFFALFIFSTTGFAATSVAAKKITGQEVPAVQVLKEITGKNSKTAVSADKKSKKTELIISSEHLSVTKGRRIQLTATVTGVEETPEIVWTSSDEKVAKVDKKGRVRGVEAGRVTITASTTVNGKKLSASYALNVVTSSNLVKDFLEERQVLSYQYSYIDDYYYTNDKEAWQYNFGYGKLYDVVAPYVLLEYDYVRVFFTYEDKDWMIQLWKGQYGLVFYGSEIGIYTKPHSEEDDTFWTFYRCPEEDDWVKMEMTLYHRELNGKYTREFSRPYDDYWWCTGFKDGHLRIEEPANELRMYGRITLKDKKMASLFTEGLKTCGFEQNKNLKDIEDDQFYAKGKDVYFQWQNISEAENTMPIKITAGYLFASNIILFILSIISFFSLIGLGAIIFI